MPSSSSFFTRRLRSISGVEGEALYRRDLLTEQLFAMTRGGRRLPFSSSFSSSLDIDIKFQKAVKPVTSPVDTNFSGGRRYFMMRWSFPAAHRSSGRPPCVSISFRTAFFLQRFRISQPSPYGRPDGFVRLLSALGEGLELPGFGRTCPQNSE